MQPIKKFNRALYRLANGERYIFSLSDFAGILPEHSGSALRSLVARAEGQGIVKRVCRGIYLSLLADYDPGYILFHAAARLRADRFNYISLETVLSDAGIISQVLPNWVTIMSTGRSGTIDCGQFGSIEFVHTKRDPSAILDSLVYDSRCRLWRASIPLAAADLKHVRRNLDLVNWQEVSTYESA